MGWFTRRRVRQQRPDRPMLIYVTRAEADAANARLAAAGIDISFRSHYQGELEYFVFQGNDTEKAKQWLLAESITKPLRYYVVETPDGNWGKDIDGLYLESLPESHFDITATTCSAALLAVHQESGLDAAARGKIDNFIAEVSCGKCYRTWHDGLRYRNLTAVRCPACRTLNSVDSSGIYPLTRKGQAKPDENTVQQREAVRSSAEAGDTEAMYELGGMLLRDGDRSEGESWVRRAAENGHVEAMNSVGLLRQRAGALDDADLWYRRAAEAGHVWGMSNLAMGHRRRGELAEAVTWLHRAADNGHAGAMYNLGVIRLEEQDHVEAESWFRRAAEGGQVDAMFNLGVLHADRDELDEAANWYQRAIDLGDNDGKVKLAEMNLFVVRARQDPNIAVIDASEEPGTSADT